MRLSGSKKQMTVYFFTYLPLYEKDFSYNLLGAETLFLNFYFHTNITIILEISICILL